MICQECGEINPKGAKFCKNCGCPLNKDESVKAIVETEEEYQQQQQNNSDNNNWWAICCGCCVAIIIIYFIASLF